MALHAVSTPASVLPTGIESVLFFTAAATVRTSSESIFTLVIGARLITSRLSLSRIFAISMISLKESAPSSPRAASRSVMSVNLILFIANTPFNCFQV